MKGVPSMPRCGFSNFVVEVLKFYSKCLLYFDQLKSNIEVRDYKAIDVTKDEFLKESIKRYSEWNTFPQLYVNGKLIGGSDIVNDMHKEGSLKQLFQDNELIPKDN